MLKRTFRPAARNRQLRMECLEDRRVLATVTVDLGLDFEDSNGNFTIDQLNNDPGPDGKISLFEAIRAANNTTETDTILFDSLLSGTTIMLTGGQLPVAESVIIDATDQDITIDGSNNLADQRIFEFFGDSDHEYEIIGLTLTGGDTEGPGGPSYQKMWISPCAIP